MLQHYVSSCQKDQSSFKDINSKLSFKKAPQNRFDPQPSQPERKNFSRQNRFRYSHFVDFVLIKIRLFITFARTKIIV